MQKSSTSQSGIFNPRALLAFTLGSLGVFLAIFSFRGMPSPQTVASADAGEREYEQNRYMPTGGREFKADDLSRMEEEWHNRLTYPTGHFDPAWIRKAEQQDSFIPRRIPAGLRNPKVTLRQKSFVKGSKGVSKSPLALDVNAFTALGPAPERMTGCTGCFDYTKTEGRVNAVVVDPTTTTNGSIVAYAATNGGGVWKTTNCCSSTTTWAVLTDAAAISTTAVDTLALDPNDHNTLYAGTGDLNYGSFSMGSQGILKTTDGGANWTVLGASVFGSGYIQPAGQFPQYDSVGKVRVDPNNSSKVVAGTKKGLFFSYDAGVNWTGPCYTNAFTTQRQDITGLELTNMGGGVTRIIAAVGVRGFPTAVQYDLGKNGANGIYKGTMPASGCPSDFVSIASNANGFVFGTTVTGSPYATGANMNAGSGVPCDYPITGGTATFCGGATPTAGGANNLSRIDIAVAPSNPNYIYAQVGSIQWNNNTGTNTGCGNTTGCQLGAWVSSDGGTSWTFMAGSAGGALRSCAGSGAANSTNGGDYPQNWYDQGIAVDPNDPTRAFIDTLSVYFATATGTTWYDTSCAYSQTALGMHADQHVLTFVPGSSSIMIAAGDGGLDAATDVDTTALNTKRPTWFNMDNGLNNIEFYAGDISGNFATDPSPQAVGGAQDNGPSSVTFSGSPTGPVQWQMGLGGDGFSGQIQTLNTRAQGTITVSALGVAGQQFQIGTQTFTWAATRTTTGTVAVGTSSTTAATNIRTAVNADIPTQASAGGAASSVIITATTPGTAGNTVPFTNVNSGNLTFNGTGTLGGTTMGSATPSNIFWQGNNSGGLSRCILNCTVGGATWTSSKGGWTTSETQSFVLPVNLFHGGIPGGDDCDPNATSSGCGHMIAGTTRVWETISGVLATVPSASWYVTNNPPGAITGPNLCKGTLGSRSFINQVKYSPKYFSVAIVGTNDGNVQIGFNLGTGVASQATWVDVTAANAILPNRPVLGIALDPSVPAANVPIGYAAVGGFDENTPTTPGHLFRVACDANCATPVWLNKSGNLPNIPIDSVIVNPNFPQQVFAGTDFGLYYTDDINAPTPVWYRFNAGLPNMMIWDMQIDRGSTALSLWTRSRGAFAWPLPLGPIQGPVTVNSVGSRMTHPGAATYDVDLTGGNGVECRAGANPGQYTVVFTFGNSVTNVDSASVSSGTGSVASSNIGGNPQEYIVNLTGVTNAQHLGVALSNVQDSANHFSTSVSGTLNLLIGDSNGDGSVNSGDINQTKGQSGSAVTGSNFRDDTNVDGSINSGDISLVKSKSGTALP